VTGATNVYVAGMKQMPWWYNWVYLSTYLWLGYWGLRTATDNVTGLTVIPYVAIGLAPMVILWIWKRLRSGTWV
jgi:hypothetical protein